MPESWIAVGKQIIVRPVYQNPGKIHLPDGCIKEYGELHGVVLSAGPECFYKWSEGDKVIYYHGEGTPLPDDNISIHEKRIVARVL